MNNLVESLFKQNQKMTSNKKISKTMQDKILSEGIKEDAMKVLPPEDIDTHASDLYLKVSDKSKELVNNYRFKDSVTTFIDNINQELWYDIPFANMGDDFKKASLDEEKYVIYKEFGKYKGTPESNYRVNHRDANKVQNFNDFDNPQEIIDYLIKYGSKKSKDDYIVIDESKRQVTEDITKEYALAQELVDFIKDFDFYEYLDSMPFDADEAVNEMLSQIIDVKSRKKISIFMKELLKDSDNREYFQRIKSLIKKLDKPFTQKKTENRKRIKESVTINTLDRDLDRTSLDTAVKDEFAQALVDLGYLPDYPIKYYYGSDEDKAFLKDVYSKELSYDELVKLCNRFDELTKGDYQHEQVLDFINQYVNFPTD